MTPAVDATRLWRTLAEVSDFGETAAGGLHRLAASVEDGLARDYVVAAARDLGCGVRIDEVGNIFARRPGGGHEPRAILIGSHLDSQPMAGKYDGPYGVIAALEVLRSLDDAGTVTHHPVELVVWTNEEGARFAPAMMGSACFAGRLAATDLHDRQDTSGVALGDALRAIGYLGNDVVTHDEHACYLELHIEQGPILQETGTDVGVVTAVQGMRWNRVTLTGQAAHAGTTPMGARRDALAAAARVVTGVERIGIDLAIPGRATVGFLQVSPNSPNVVPSGVELMVEFRHPEASTLDAMENDLDTLLDAVSVETGVTHLVRRELVSPPVAFDEGLIAVVQAAADATGRTSRRMVSGAGHDACQTAPHIPTAMVFIPCDQGISHAEQERITPEWALNGAAVLLQAVLLADQR